MTVAAPSSPDELRLLFATALDHDGPFALRYPRGAAPGEGTAPLEPVEIGRMQVVSPGRDVALLAVGKMVGVASQAADRLAARRVSATVVDARFVKPIDPAIVELIARHRAAVTIEDGTLPGGFGSGVVELAATSGLGIPIRRLGLPDLFVEHGAPAALHTQFGLDADAVARAALGLIPAADALAG
jgi:1-deoxy-D-xylulose-5-phosphate synthase